VTKYDLYDGTVGLRPVADSDVDFLWKNDCEPVAYNRTNLCPRSFIAKQMEKGGFWDDKTKLFIVEIERDGAAVPIGDIGVHFRDVTGECEVGTKISAAYRGTGAGTRAKMLLVDYLFRAFRIERVSASTHVENAPAIRSLEKCGFKREGIARNIRFIHGKYCDFYNYGMTRSDYRAAKRDWKLYGNTDPVEPREVPDSEKAQTRLVGKLIAIRPTEKEDGIFLSNLWSQPYPYLDHEICTLDDYNKWYDEGDFWGDTNHTFVIETLDGKPLGQVGMWGYDKRNGEAEVGTLLVDVADRGKGYGTEAKLLAMGHGFDVWPINRIYAGTSQYNRAARCSLLRAGLRFEAVFSGVEEGRRPPSGAALYGVSREEWYGAREVPDA